MADTPKVTQKEKRYSNWTIKKSYYYYTHDADGNVVNPISKDDWKKMILDFLWSFLAQKKINYALAIFHDKDMDEKTKKFKDLHVHVNVNLPGGKEQSVVMNMFDITREKDAGYIRNKASAYQYLIHITQDAIKAKKHIYDVSEIIVISNDKDFVSYGFRNLFVPSKTKDKEEIDIKELKNILHKKVIMGLRTVKDVRKVYMDTEELGSSKWVADRKLYETDVKEWLEECNDWYKIHNACKTTIMIMAKGGSQKTDLAQRVIAPHYMNHRGVHVPSAPMGRITFDPIGTYKGENVTILNEMKGDSWILEGFCECLDPTHSGTTGSRYFDRPFFPDYVIMTTSTDIETFIESMFLKWLNVGEHYKNNRYYVETSNKYKDDGSPDIYVRTNIDNMININTKFEPYSTDSKSPWNKVWQVRRRIPILIRLHDGIASIDLLDYSKEMYAFGSYGKDCYIHFIDIPYSLTDENVINDFLEALDAAILKYYYMNNFDVTPKTVLKPVITL